MSLLERIRDCNRADLARFRPLVVAGAQVGWLRHDLVDAIAATGAFRAAPGGRIELDPAIDGFALRSAAFDRAAGELERRGLAAQRSGPGERIAVGVAHGAPPLFELERSAAACFGVRSYGVHVNGYVRRDDGLWMWLARRAATRAEYPGMWDNLVGGGLRAGGSLDDDLRRECGEEAGLGPELAARARPGGLVSYCREVRHGLAPNVAFVFDLELDRELRPAPVDGEVERFELMPIADVQALVASTTAVKPNCNLVIIDFLVRHGMISPRSPDYVEIVARLRSGALPSLAPSLPGGARTS